MGKTVYGEIDFVGMLKKREERINELKCSMDEELAAIRVKYADLLAEYEPEKEEYERRQQEFERKWRPESTRGWQKTQSDGASAPVMRQSRSQARQWSTSRLHRKGGIIMDPVEYILGARPYDFQNDKNERIAGVSVFIAEKNVTGAVGYVAEKVSMSNDDFAATFGALADFEKIVMKPVVISYNKRGKPVAVDFIPQQSK